MERRDMEKRDTDRRVTRKRQAMRRKRRNQRRVIIGVMVVLLLMIILFIASCASRDNSDSESLENQTEEQVEGTVEEGEEAATEEATDEATEEVVEEDTVIGAGSTLLTSVPEYSEGVSGSFPEGVSIVNDPEDLTVCINKLNFLPDGWSPSDLVTVEGSFQLRSEAAEAYTTMVAAANADGIEVILVSAYRTQSYQTGLYNNYYAKDPENAPTYSAYPRSSEHELGLAVDVSYDYSLHSDLDDYPLGIWMIEHAYEYGWIMSYPEDKTDITGYIFEPWHWRYVGVELATYLWGNDLTLEEYTYH